MTGPRQTLRTRRKQRVLGIWVNVDSREFVRVPSYLAVLSNRPVAEIASRTRCGDCRSGSTISCCRNASAPDIADTVRDDPFRAAFVRLQDAARPLPRSRQRR